MLWLGHCHVFKVFILEVAGSKMSMYSAVLAQPSLLRVFYGKTATTSLLIWALDVNYPAR